MIPEKKISFLHTMKVLTYLNDLNPKLDIPMDVLALKNEQQ
jgi:hypothetical protein